MKGFIFKHFLCFFISLVYYNGLGQNTCDCPAYDNIEASVNAFFFADSRDTNELKRLTSPLLNSTEACKSRAYEILAEYAFNTREKDSLLNYVQLSTHVLKRLNCADLFYYKNNMLWADYHYLNANYNEALNYSYKSLTIAEELKSIYKQAFMLLKIAQLFNRMKQSDRGIEYARQSIPLIKKIPPSVERGYLLNLLASRYYFYFQDSKKKECLDSTAIFSREAKDLGYQFNNRKVLIQAYSRLEGVEFSKNNYPQAFIYNDSVLKFCTPGVHDRELYVAYGDKGEKYMELKNFALARRYADSCVFYAKKSKEASAISNALSLVYEIAKKSENWKEALIVSEEITTINDSLVTIEKSKALNELEKKYNQAKNEKTIKELAQEKRIYLLLALAALLGIVIFLFYVRQQSLKHKQTILETEQRLNRARMNPHFFFNALTSLQSFALRENDGKSLASNLSKFSHIMRETLESTYKEYVTIEQEMEFLNEYLEIQKIRFPKKFTYNVEADEAVEIDELRIPSMIIQPFVENSIEHGFAGLEHEGHVDVLFKKENQEILIEIKDNGRGLTQTTKINEHISRASQIIKDRIYLLNLKLKTKARFSIDNQEGGNGVIVKIHLPVIYNNESINN